MLQWWRRRAAMPDEGPDPSAREEQLSAYLDGRLGAELRADVEAAVAEDEGLRETLAELRLVKETLGELGAVRAPRPFTLSGPPLVAARASRIEVAARLGAAIAALAFVAVLVPRQAVSTREAASSAPSQEMAAPRAADGAGAGLAATPAVKAASEPRSAGTAAIAPPAQPAIAPPGATDSAAPVIEPATIAPERTGPRGRGLAPALGVATVALLLVSGALWLRRSRRGSG